MTRLRTIAGWTAAFVVIALGAEVIWYQHCLLRALAAERSGDELADRRLEADIAAAQANVRALQRKMAVPAAETRRSAAALRALQIKVAAERSRESVALDFGPLLRRLGLSESQRRRFEDLIIQERSAVRDAVSAARALGLQQPDAYESAAQDALASIDPGVQALLGADGFAQFEDYRQTLPVEQTVEQLSSRLEALGQPLTADQADRLALLINQSETAAFQQNETMFAMLGMDAAPLTHSVVAAASAVLSAPQLEVLQAMQTEQAALARLAKALGLVGPS